MSEYIAIIFDEVMLFSDVNIFSKAATQSGPGAGISVTSQNGRLFSKKSFFIFFNERKIIYII